jgi:hypothetical protein
MATPLAIGEGHRVLLMSLKDFTPNIFGQVIDLERVAKVCDLQGYENAQRGGYPILTASKWIMSWRGLLDTEPNRVSAWDLKTGRRTALGGKSWSNRDRPEKIANPRGDRLLLAGNLHDSGMAHLELWDLVRMRRLREATFPTLSTPLIAYAQDLNFSVELPDFPEKGATRTIYWRCADGAELEKPSANTPRCVYLARDPYTQQSPWLLWRDGAGLAFQSSGKEKVRLEKTAFSYNQVVGPSRDGRILAIEARGGGGLWETDTGRRIVEFPPSQSHLCRDLDPTGHWAMTVSATDREIWVWTPGRESRLTDAGPRSLPTRASIP